MGPGVVGDAASAAAGELIPSDRWSERPGSVQDVARIAAKLRRTAGHLLAANHASMLAV